MKKITIVFTSMLLMFSIASVSAARCELTARLINQDPYPALPGEYVNVVFQLSGLENPECEQVTFELNEKFPFKLDPGVSPKASVDSGTYSRRFQSSLIIPYKLRVDNEALDGDNLIEVVYYSGKDGALVYRKDLIINVEDVRTDFEVSLKDFDSKTNTLTFEILNIGEHDIQALTVDVPKQENLEVKGSSRNIVGDLDSNEDTTFKFEAIPNNGDIKLDITYTDAINVRRTVSKIVSYDSSYFMNRKADQTQTISPWFYVTTVLVATWVIVWIRRRIKKRRMKNSERHHKK